MIKKITLTGLLFAFIFCSFSKEYKKDAIAYLQKNQKELKLTEQDIAGLTVLTDYFDDYSQINRVILQQNLNGIPLKNAQIGVHFKNEKVVHFTNSGVYDLRSQVNSLSPSISAKDAVVNAASHVGVHNFNINDIQLQEKVDTKQKLYIFKPVNGLTQLEIHVQLILARNNENKVYLTWVVQFHTLDEQHFWNIDVNATDGSLVNKYDQILHCDFGTGKFLESQSNHQHNANAYRETPALPAGVDNDVAGPMAGSYRVYPYTVESPIYGTRQLISNPDDAVASPFGWHDENGIAGAEYTITRGNNVYAYTDKDANNNVDPGSSPDGTASLNFDFPLDFSSQLDTLVNSKAIVTQLFYMNNIMHDIFYKYGFTDASRNFQVKNYASGNTATDNDPVYAEAHDGSGTNNANFATAPDGTNSTFSRSRMQMFMWDGTPPSTLTYNTPASIAGDIDHGSQNGWGPCTYNIVNASVANATSATTPPSYVCGPVNNGSAITGKVALIDRGTCNFSEKVFNAQLAGAIGVIIINRQSAGDSIIGMASGINAAGVTIPALFVNYADGQKLRDNLATATVSMSRVSTTNCLELDGSLDNGIVAHEYGHGISTRLTGLSTNTGGTSTCLSNEEQAGEGWSDFFALALSKKPADNKNTARGIGNYASGFDVNGIGIRKYPYSYDMSVSPVTYADVEGDPAVHAIGEIWCSAIWDMYWLLVEKYGYSTDLYNGTLGNNRAIKLVVEGLKLQPCSPGFLDSRNAILKADSILYGYADRCEIWTAFARRGMGFSALQGTSASATDQTAAFNLHPLCNTSPTATASFTASDTTVCIGSTLTFTNTSTASVGTPDSVRWTIPGGTPSTSTSATTVTPTFNTAGTYVISLIAYKSGNASTAFTKSIRVKANATATLTSAAGTNAQTKCVGTAITNITYAIGGSGTGAGVTGLPAGVTGAFAGGVFTISGTPSATGTFNYTVTTTGTCTQATATGSIVVNPNAAIALTSAAGTNAQTKCSGVAITNITYSVTGGGTGAGVTGLPAGVTGSFAGGVFTISGTPSATGTFNYTVTTTGTCTQATATGSIIVNSNAAITLTSAAGTNVQTKCAGTAITNITYSVTGGGTGAGVTGLPAGVTGTFAAGVFTISGTPSATGTFNYTVTTTGNCTQTTATGSIVVNPSATAVLTSAAGSSDQNLCVNTAITTITYSISNATGATVTGLPTGVTGSYSGGVFTISGTPSVTGGFNYTVTTTGSTCTAATQSGFIAVNPNAAISLTSAAGTNAQTLCVGIAITNITYSVTGGGTGAGVTGLPAGVTGTFAGGVFTISGSPSATGTFNYTVTTTGNCTQTTATGTITVNTCGCSSPPTVTLSSTSGSTCGVTPKTITGNTFGGSATSVTLTENGTGSLNISSASISPFSFTYTPGTGESGSVTITVTTNNPNGNPCVAGTASYTLSVTPNATLTLTSAAGTNGQTKCNNSAITAITYAVGGSATGAGATGLPSGVTGIFTGGVFTIAGTPTTTGAFNYTVTTTGGTCTQATANGSINVNAIPSTPTITQSNDTLNSSTVVVGASYEWYLGASLVATTSVPYYKFTVSGSYTVKVIKDNCPSALSAAFSASATGVRNNSNSVKLFEVYPNPTEGRLVMNLSLYKSSNVNISIFTPEGREVYVKAYGNTKALTDELNMNDFANGVYIIKLRVDDETYYHKVVKN